MSRPRRVLAGAGVVMILAGIGVLGWIGWQLWGTTWQSERRHEEIGASLEESWASGSRSVRVEEGTATAVVRIPAFGEDYAVPLLEGTTDEVLAAGFGHDSDSADPGEPGNVVLAGHRVTHGEPLADMPQLEPGDEVVVETAEATHTYVLDTGGDDLVVRFDEGWVLAPVPVNPDPGGVRPDPDADSLLTLTTCAELFHTDDRLVAFGHLVSSDPRR